MTKTELESLTERYQGKALTGTNNDVKGRLTAEDVLKMVQENAVCT